MHLTKKHALLNDTMPIGKMKFVQSLFVLNKLKISLLSWYFVRVILLRCSSSVESFLLSSQYEYFSFLAWLNIPISGCETNAENDVSDSSFHSLMSLAFPTTLAERLMQIGRLLIGKDYFLFCKAIQLHTKKCSAGGGSSMNVRELSLSLSLSLSLNVNSDNHCHD
jgi:hypothetical protein